MEDKVFNNLITLYKTKGVSFEHLLKNEVFKALPVDVKIKLIKEHASELSDGIRFDSSDVKYLLKTIGSGAVAGFMLHQAYNRAFATNHPNPVLATIIAASSSVPIKNALGNVSKLRKDIAQKNLAKGYLKEVDSDSAIKLMAHINGLK